MSNALDSSWQPSSTYMMVTFFFALASIPREILHFVYPPVVSGAMLASATRRSLRINQLLLVTAAPFATCFRILFAITNWDLEKLVCKTDQVRVAKKHDSTFCSKIQ